MERGNCRAEEKAELLGERAATMRGGGGGEPQAPVLCRTSPDLGGSRNGARIMGSALQVLLQVLLPCHSSFSLSKFILRSPFCYSYQIPLCSYQENKTRENCLGSIGAPALRPSQNREKNIRLRPKEAES